MRKFKLIKEYPNSPKLGFITEDKHYIKNSAGDFLRIGCNDTYIKDLTGFWEEVFDKDYEILSFNHSRYKDIFYDLDSKKRNDPYIYDLRKQNTSPIGNKMLNTLLSDTEFKIHSIKRLSDGEVFTIGDEVQDSLTDNLTNYKIQKIEHFYPGVKIICQAESGTTMPLNTIRKAKISLFTTEDNIDIFEGDVYYFVPINKNSGWPEWKIRKEEAIKNRDFSCSNWKDFSTKEAAEEYILMNKPCLSINNIKNIIKRDTVIKTENIINILKNTVKSKL